MSLLFLLLGCAVAIGSLGILGFMEDNSSDVKASDERQTGTDNAILSRGPATVAGVTAYNQSTGEKSNIVGPGSIQLQKGGTVQINNENVSDDVLKSALEGYNEQNKIFVDALDTQTRGLKDILESNNAADFQNAANLTELVKGQTGLWGQVLDQFSRLAQSTSTGGDSERNKIILYVVFGVLGLVGFLLWRRR